MFFKFKNKKITQILSIVPDKIIKFEDEVKQYNFPEKRTLRMKEIMGFNEHRLFDEGVILSDVAVFGLKYMFDKKMINQDDIDALIYVSNSHDYILPPTSNIIQGRLGLKTDMICLDIEQACAGFIIGLLQAFMLLDTGAVKKAVLITGDTLKSKVSKKDRNSWPIGGESCSITIIENGDSSDIFASVYMDGTGYEALIIPAGGLRMPSNQETAKMRILEDGNERSLDNFLMDGSGVFNFVQTVAPVEIKKAMDFANVTDKDIFAYLFHQPNRFMLEKLADKMGISMSKMPANVVENFGNSSGGTIPLATTFNYSDVFVKEKHKVCFSAFGAGLTCATIIMDLGKLEHCELIEYDSDRKSN